MSGGGRDNDVVTTSTAEPPAPGLLLLFRHELVTVWGHRGVRWSIGLGVVLSVAIAASVAAIAGATWDDWTPSQQADFHPVALPVIGTVASTTAFVIAGVLAVAPGYEGGNSLPAANRGRWAAAKLAAVALLTALSGLVSMAAMIGFAQLLLGGYGAPSVAVTGGEAMRAIIAGGLLTPVLPLLAAALAFAVRHTGMGVMLALFLAWAPEFAGPRVPAALQDNFFAYLPGPARDGVALGHVFETTWVPGVAGGLFATVGWVIAAVAFAVVAARRG